MSISKRNKIVLVIVIVLLVVLGIMELLNVFLFDPNSKFNIYHDCIESYLKSNPNHFDPIKEDGLKYCQNKK